MEHNDQRRHPLIVPPLTCSSWPISTGPVRSLSALRGGSAAADVGELPSSVRYVKNGPGGRWWPAAKAHGQIHAGWKSVPDEMLRAGDLAGLLRAVREEFGARSGAMQDFNALKALVDRPS